MTDEGSPVQAVLSRAASSMLDHFQSVGLEQSNQQAELTESSRRPLRPFLCSGMCAGCSIIIHVKHIPVIPGPAGSPICVLKTVQTVDCPPHSSPVTSVAEPRCWHMLSCLILWVWASIHSVCRKSGAGISLRASVQLQDPKNIIQKNLECV